MATRDGVKFESSEIKINKSSALGTAAASGTGAVLDYMKQCRSNASVQSERTSSLPATEPVTRDMSAPGVDGVAVAADPVHLDHSLAPSGSFSPMSEPRPLVLSVATIPLAGAAVVVLTL